MIYIESKRKKLSTLQSQYPNAEIVDVTSKGEFKELSPFYPHGGIPVPGQGNFTSCSVEGVWQGLKCFEGEGIDINSFLNDTMKNIKRTCRTHGKCLGHKLHGELLGYIDARKQIYVPTYMWMLEHKAQKSIEALREIMKTHDLVLLDYDTNDDVEDPRKPLSHASLIKLYLQK